MIIDKCAEMVNDAEYHQYIESSLDEADRVADNSDTKYYTHEEIFSKMRGKASV